MTPSAQLACPQCGAATRPDAAWCSLCLTPFGTPAETPTITSSEVELDPLTAPLEQVIASSVMGVTDDQPPAASGVDPIGVESESESASEPVGQVPGAARNQMPDAETIDALLALLAAEHREKDSAAPMVGRFEDKSTRVAVAIGGILVMTAVGFLTLTVFGLLT